MGEDGAAAATGAGAAAGKGREGDSRAEEGQFWLQEERKALCRRFSVARAL